MKKITQNSPSNGMNFLLKIQNHATNTFSNSLGQSSIICLKKHFHLTEELEG